MTTADLIAKLVEIEQALGTTGSARARALLFEAEEAVLRLEQQMIETLRDNERLRERMENCEGLTAARLSQAEMAEDGSGLMELSGPLGRRSWQSDKFKVN